MTKERLTKWWLFRVAIFAPLVLSIILFILGNPWRYDLCFSFECYKFAYDLFQVPIILTGLALSLSLLVGMIHKSIQTDDMLKVAREANLLQDALRHREVFITELRESLSSQMLQDWNISKLYQSLFPNVNKRDYRPTVTQEWLELVHSASAYEENVVWFINMIDEFTENEQKWFKQTESKVFGMLNKVEATYLPYARFEDKWGGQSPSNSEEFHENLEIACAEVSKRYDEFVSILTIVRSSFVDSFSGDHFKNVIDELRTRELRYQNDIDPLFSDDVGVLESIKQFDFENDDKYLLVAASVCFDHRYE